MEKPLKKLPAKIASAHKFSIGTTIALKRISSFGYGIRPVGVVEGYASDGKYIVEMEADEGGDFLKWIEGKYTPTGQRKSCQEIHFKKNIELHFKKVSKSDPNFVYA